MKILSSIILITGLSFSLSAISNDDDHNDKEHEKAEKNLDDKHWDKAHGSGVPDKPDRGRQPPSSPGVVRN